MSKMFFIAGFSLLICFSLAGQSDSTQISHLLAEAKSYMGKNQFDTAIVKLQQANGLYAKQLNYRKGKADVSHNLSICYYYVREYKNAVHFSRLSIEERLETGDEINKSIGDSYHLLGILYKSLGDFDSSMVCMKKAIEIRSKVLGVFHKDVAKTYNNLGNLYSDLNEPADAIHAYQSCINIYEKSGDLINEPLATVYNNIALQYMDKRDYRTSRFFLEKALSVLAKLPTKTTNVESVTLSSLGSYYSETGNFQKSIQYYLKSIEVTNDLYGENNEVTGNTYTSLGHCYYSFGKKAKSEQAYQKALEILKQNFGENHESIAQIYSALSGYGDFEQCQVYTQKAEKILLSLPNVELRDIAMFYYNTSSRYSNFEQYEEAISYVFKSQEIFSRSPDTSFQLLGQALANSSLGYLYGQMKQFQKAERYYNQYLELINSGAIYDDLSATHFENLRHISQMYLNWYKYAGDLIHLKKAGSFAALCDKSLLRFLESIQDENSKSLHLLETRKCYEAGIEASILLQQNGGGNNQGIGFMLAEKTKAFNLYRNVLEMDALHFGGIPDSLLNLENSLRSDIAYYDKKDFEWSKSSKPFNDSTRLFLNDRLLHYRQQYESLKKSFETNYPEYHRLRYQAAIEDIASVQRDLLASDQTMLEYFVGDSNVYIFRIGKESYDIQMVKKDFPLENWVTQLRSGMSDFFTDPDKADQYSMLSESYSNAAHNLYQKLIAPVADRLSERVVIIPDAILGYVPFEALLVEKPVEPTRWAQHHYFQNEHTLSYCYSATMLREMKQRQHKQHANLSFVGFAPHYDGDTSLLSKQFQYADDVRKDLKPLPYSGEEVYRASKIMNGRVWVGDAASGQNFLEQSGQANVIHLATHGQANDRAGDYCFLVFSTQKDSLAKQLLYARDIYNLQLNADLVTLSACETGIGELQNGEGIISLARAFAYSGAKSIVTSLWSVSDAKTKDLMVDFYKNLRKGQDKNEALRQSKLAFLKRNKGLAAHPFFWAGFVGIGDMRALRVR